MIQRATKLIGVIGLLGCVAVPAASQIPGEARLIVSATYPDATLVTDCASYFTKGNWPELQRSVISRLHGQTIRSGAKEHKFDFDSNYYVFSMVVRGEEVRFTVHQPMTEAFSSRLPGLTSLYLVYMTTGVGDSFRSAYVSTPQADPLIEKLPGFLKAIDLTRVSYLLSASPSPGSVSLTVTEVVLPLPRSTVVFKDEIGVKPWIDKGMAAGIVEAAEALQERVMRHEGRASSCAKDLANDLLGAVHTQLDPVVAGTAVAVAPANLRTALIDTTDTRLKQKDCAITGAFDPDSALHARVIRETEEAFLALVPSTEDKLVKGEFTYENLPLTRLSLGVMTALMLDVDDESRVKLGDGGTLVRDPLSGPLALAIVNIHPHAYDSKSLKLTRAERFRFFAGVAVTPEFGLTGGFGAGIVRGLSVNAGYAVVRVNGLRASDQLGAAPRDALNPFADDDAGIWFIGFGYNF